MPTDWIVSAWEWMPTWGQAMSILIGGPLALVTLLTACAPMPGDPNHEGDNAP